MRRIEIIVTPEGDTSVHTRGFSASNCREASRYLEEALGKRAGERLTTEFHLAHHVDQQARQQN